MTDKDRKTNPVYIHEDFHAELKSEAAGLKISLTDYISEILFHRKKLNLDYSDMEFKKDVNPLSIFNDEK